MIIMIIGLILVYISSVMMTMIYIREQRKLRWYDFVVSCIPVVRTIYISITVEEDQ